MRRSSATKATSPGCALWANLHEMTPTLVIDDLCFVSLSSKVVEPENALCNQDKLFCKVFHENKKLNLELENSFTEIASLWSMHDDMSGKPCENCNMIMMNLLSMASQLKSAKLELQSSFLAVRCLH
jgi:hypothetical protein